MQPPLSHCEGVGADCAEGVGDCAEGVGAGVKGAEGVGAGVTGGSGAPGWQSLSTCSKKMKANNRWERI